MKKVLVLMVLGLGLSAQLYACMWEFKREFQGRREASKAFFPVPRGHELDLKSDGLWNFESDVETRAQGGDYEASIDLGVLRVYQGKYKEAEETFAKVIQKWPDKYEACANYGTILEVNGKLNEALKWLKKAIEINPNSHDGSEWLHVAIVEAKIAKMNPVNGAALTGQDFGNEAEPKPVVNKQATRKLQHDLFYQLNERMTFIEPKDPYIAALLFELGNVCLLFEDPKSALENYTAAERYGFKSALLKKRKGLAKNETPLTVDFPSPSLQDGRPEPPAEATAETHASVPQPSAADIQLPPVKVSPQQANTLIKVAVGAAAVLFLQFLIHLIYRARRKNDVPASLPENAAGPSRN